MDESWSKGRYAKNKDKCEQLLVPMHSRDFVTLFEQIRPVDSVQANDRITTIELILGAYLLCVSAVLTFVGVRWCCQDWTSNPFKQWQLNKTDVKFDHEAVMDTATVPVAHVYPQKGKYRDRLIIAYDVSLINLKKIPTHTLNAELAELGRITVSKEHLAQFVGYLTTGCNILTMIYSAEMCYLLSNCLRRGWINSNEIKLSLIRDLAMGLGYMHDNLVRCHGDLRPDRCLIDQRFTLKIVLTKLPCMLSAGCSNQKTVGVDTCSNLSLAWAAPEVVKNPQSVSEHSPQSDVYSFSIIAHEICFQRGPFGIRENRVDDAMSRIYGTPTARCSMMLNSGDVVTTTAVSFDDDQLAQLVRDRARTPEKSPKVLFHPKDLADLVVIMQQCWALERQKRPSMQQVIQMLHKYYGSCDAMMNYVNRLKHASRETVNEFLKCVSDSEDDLMLAVKFLSHLMPPEMCYGYLTDNPQKTINSQPEVSIIFINLVNLFELTRGKKPIESMEIVERLIDSYEKLVDLYDVSPIHLVGPSVVLCSGLCPENRYHASEIAQIALQILHQLRSTVSKGYSIKVGFHSGRVGAGMVGKINPQFGLFGSTVNTASRMASTSQPFSIQMSADAVKALQAVNEPYHATSLGDKEVKGLGKMKVYSLKGFGRYTDCSKSDLPLDQRLDGKLPYRRMSGMPRDCDEGRTSILSMISKMRSISKPSKPLRQLSMKVKSKKS